MRASPMRTTRSPRPLLSASLTALLVLALAAPAAAKPRRQAEPVVIVTSGSVKVIEAEREQLRTRLSRLDSLLADAQRKARRPEPRERLEHARQSVNAARRMLGFLPAGGRGAVIFEREEGGRADDQRADAVYTRELIVIEAGALRRELSLAERALAELEGELRFPGGREIVAQGRLELQASLRIVANLFGPPMAPPPRPPPHQPPAPNQPWPMADQAFESLLSTLSGQAWARDRLGVLESAARANWFVVSQVVQVVQRFDFSHQRLDAVRLVKDRILDPQHNYLLYSAFPFASEKAELGRILAGQPSQLPDAIGPHELKRLLDRVTAGAFAERWFKRLTSESQQHWFLVEQVLTIAERFPTPDGRLRAITILRTRIVDPQSHARLEALFPHAAYKKRVADLFR